MIVKKKVMNLVKNKVVITLVTKTLNQRKNQMMMTQVIKNLKIKMRMILMKKVTKQKTKVAMTRAKQKTKVAKILQALQNPKAAILALNNP